jgi:carbonic anhydrase
MSAEIPPDAAVPPAAGGRRFTPKLMIAAGATAALLLAGVGGAAVWLWPKAPDASESKAARAAARRAAAKASAPAPAEVAKHAPDAASAAQMSAAVAAAPASAASAATTADGGGSTVATQAATATAADEAGPAPVPMHAAAEAPLDRLQRRLGEVLGPKGAIEAGQGGELRVLTRSQTLSPVRHDSTAGETAAAAPGLAAPLRESLHGRPWSYGGQTGPQAWGRLKPEFRQCAVGQRQSPIDIREGIALDLEAVQFNYQPGSFSVVDTGHTVQVEVAAGNSIEVNGRRYLLQQFHFHRPSEERIDGRQFEMDVHLVHRDAEGRLAVVAVLLERGAAQPLLQTVWNNLPLEKHEPFAGRGELDPGQLLPADRRYYTYMGSLTTPPCTEGVLWLVMQQPLTVSAQQIDIFSRLYPMNARPIQRAAGRMIKQSN